ncbi:MAG: methionyl-tRNA formyltransferase, partial [bacterium]
MRIVFWGTPHWALYPLEALKEREEIVGVVCQPDKPAGRGLSIQAPPTKQFALSHSIPVLQPDNLRDPSFVEKLKELSPEMCVIAGYGKYIPPEILSIPPYGFINLHPSLLPRWRGADPVRWTILEGDDRTGITIHYASERMDAGDIILQKEVPIFPDDTYGSLCERLFKEGAVLLLSAISLIKEGKAPRIPQNEDKATYAPPLKKEDFRIDWGNSAERIERLIRAGNPSPGAFTFFKGKMLKIWEGKAIEEEGETGRIIRIEKEGIVVACGEGSLILTSLQVEGKRRI